MNDAATPPLAKVQLRFAEVHGKVEIRDKAGL